MTEEHTSELSGAEQQPPVQTPPESPDLPGQSSENHEAPAEVPAAEASAVLASAPPPTPPADATETASTAVSAEAAAVVAGSEPPSQVAPAASGNPSRPPRQDQRGPRRQQDRGPKPEGKAGSASPRNHAKRSDQMAYKPEHVLQRLQGRPGVFRAYVHEAESLLYQIRLVGLGPSLAVLLSQTEHKSKRRIYWDISKWIFKEQRIKGKNVRSLMESIVYGDPRFLLKATHSVVNFLEELVHLSQEPAYQPHARSDQS